jgi:hypothetical protein
VSVEQAEQALAAMQANIVGHHGYLAADNVGVGKSREIALTVLDLMERAKADGRELRLVVTTKSADNIRDLIDNELYYVATGRTRDGRDLMDPTCRAGAPGARLRGRQNRSGPTRSAKGRPTSRSRSTSARSTSPTSTTSRRSARRSSTSRPHGIIGDEAHRFKNVEGAAAGGAWQNLHAVIMRGAARPQQVFAYFTATPAQTVYDYQYLYGLRLWPIDGFRRLGEPRHRQRRTRSEGRGS